MGLRSGEFLTKPALNCPFRKQSGVKLIAQPDINEFSESEVKVVARYGDPYSEFVLCI